MMLRSNKATKQPRMINLEQVFEIKITQNNTIYCVANGEATAIAAYDSERQCEVALDMLQKAIELGKTFFQFPEIKEIQGVLVNSYQEKSRNAAGKKTKGHGGS